MIKTIKVKKQMRLDELIKYIFDNDITGKRFEESSDYKSYSITHAVHVTGNGVVNVEGLFDPDTKFTVEAEEKIDNTTIFKSVVGVLKKDAIMLTNMYTTIEGIQAKYGSMKEIHAVINGKLELIWEEK